ncbi:hypothetical protein GALL_467580 [mine drainage metagenome]|uniref:Uncharacterized protein n=1 Tax=mine drainage metagenome TaxID=410659 RepID=A0A1J5PV45_9ZZZZ
MNVGVALDLGPGEQVLLHAAGQLEGGWVQALRRDRSEIDKLGRRLAGAVDQREADTAQTGVPGLDRRKRQGGGDRGVDGVAALSQDRHADISRQMLRGDHHRMRSRHRPIIGQLDPGCADNADIRQGGGGGFRHSGGCQQRGGDKGEDAQHVGPLLRWGCDDLRADVFAGQRKSRGCAGRICSGEIGRLSWPAEAC